MKKEIQIINKENRKIDTEIYAISEFLYHRNRKLWEWQSEYLSYKLFDLIHSYLLNLKRKYELYYKEDGEYHSYYNKIKENLDKCDYSIQSNRMFVPSLEITTKENIEYWYDIPSARKIEEIFEN